MNTTEYRESQTAATSDGLGALAAARAACQRIAPLWPLQNFVAVNPFVGLTELPFVEACHLLRKVAPGGMQMPLDYYREKFASGEILGTDLEAALTEGRKLLQGPWADALAGMEAKHLERALTEKPESAGGENEILSVAEAVDRAYGTSWAAAVTETIAQFCSEYFDAAQSAWRLPWRTTPLYAAWREKASINANAEVLGLRNFRRWVKALPENADAAIIHAVKMLGFADKDAVDYFHGQLMSIRGWAGHLQYRVRETGMRGGSDESLLPLLAIRLAYDAALLGQFDSPALREFWPSVEAAPAAASAVLQSFLWQLAHEHAWRRQLLGTLRAAKAAPRSERAAAQAVFCIDVRSEIFRRALEAASPKIETLGFAGFFGLPIEYIPFGKHDGPSLCPVLLSPKFRVRETLRHATPEAVESSWKRQRLGKRLTYSWNSFKTSAISCFSFVDTMGLAFGPKLIRDAFSLSGKGHPGHVTHGPDLTGADADRTGIALEDRVQLALGALRTMGLTKSFARLVLLCGHGSETANNPYGAGLDCGACGGHSGDANARVGAMILNDRAVRTALAGQGVVIPEDTHFIAGLHITTTDEVTLFDLDDAPASHERDLAELKNWLAAAAHAARRERAGLLGLDRAAPNLDRQILARSRDWAQVRPEWGLAGNAAFIAAPRPRTQAANLGGRVFLHNYDGGADSGDSTLELIMTAPMVVANWINLQYYASTVNNRVFGSGDKVTHNVVGTLGVCQGNGGDLLTGLPLQSIHDGKKFVHEPLRLHVFIEAPRERIDAILVKHEGVRQLVENGWLLLFAIEDEGQNYYHIRAAGRWDPLQCQ